MAGFQSLPGFRDFHPEDFFRRQHIFRTWRQAATSFGFQEYDAPVLEPLELYKTKSGDEIEAQLFSFTDKGGREVSLRPAKSGGHGLTGTIVTLTIAVPAIDSYFITALSYQHGLESYPGALYLNFENRSVEVADESEFTSVLKAALSSTKTQNVLSNLLSQAGAA